TIGSTSSVSAKQQLALALEADGQGFRGIHDVARPPYHVPMQFRSLDEICRYTIHGAGHRRSLSSRARSAARARSASAKDSGVPISTSGPGASRANSRPEDSLGRTSLSKDTF